jgi:hypothetical protein
MPFDSDDALDRWVAWKSRSGDLIVAVHEGESRP